MRICTSPKGVILVATSVGKRLLGCVGRPIHPRSAWNGGSENFACTEFSVVVGALRPRRCAVGPMRRSKPAIMLPALCDRGGWSSFPSPEKGRTITTRRTPYLPALLVVAAVMMACAAAVLAILGEAEATFLGKTAR